MGSGTEGETAETVAGAFMKAIHDFGDYSGAWTLLSANHRLCRAQWWIWDWGLRDERAADEMASLFATRPFAKPSPWPDFVAAERLSYQRRWGDVDTSSLPIADTAVAGDGRAVKFTRPRGSILDPFPDETAALLFMHSTPIGWQVSSFTDRLPTRGWPPEFPKGYGDLPQAAPPPPLANR